ncbi:MAG: hypothetical protein WED05_07680 [Candidatus Atabeyarchaeum deiterrae]
MSSGDNSKSFSQRPKDDYYFLMLKVNSEKEVAPAKWSLSNLDEHSAALIIDEPDERLYLWIGESVDGITKAVARRKAADVSSQGYRLENVPHPIGKVGAKRLELIEVNQADMAKDTKAKELFGDLKALFRKKAEIAEGGVLARVGAKIPEAKRELGKSITRPPAQFEEVSKALEDRFGRASEILAERETMRVRFKSREDEKVAAAHVLALLELLGGKASVEIIAKGEDKVYQVTKPAVSEAEQEKRSAFTVEDKKLRIIESNLSQEEINKLMQRASELL